jgi:hypothetical protein
VGEVNNRDRKKRAVGNEKIKEKKGELSMIYLLTDGRCLLP